MCLKENFFPSLFSFCWENEGKNNYHHVKQQIYFLLMSSDCSLSNSLVKTFSTYVWFHLL